MPNRISHTNENIHRGHRVRNTPGPALHAAPAPVVQPLAWVNFILAAVPGNVPVPVAQPAAVPVPAWLPLQHIFAPVLPDNAVDNDVDALIAQLLEVDEVDEINPINTEVHPNIDQVDVAVDDALVDQSLLSDLFHYFETIVPSSTTVASSLHAVADFINPIHWLHKAHHHAQVEIVEQELPLDQEAINDLLSDLQMDEIQPIGPGF